MFRTPIIIFFWKNIVSVQEINLATTLHVTTFSFMKLQYRRKNVWISFLVHFRTGSSQIALVFAVDGPGPGSIPVLPNKPYVCGPSILSSSVDELHELSIEQYARVQMVTHDWNLCFKVCTQQPSLFPNHHQTHVRRKNNHYQTCVEIW